MAERLELMGIYDNVYRHWSGPTHGIDIIQGKAGVTDEGSAEIFQIRHFGSVNDVAKWVLTLSLMMFELYKKNRIPDRDTDYLAWYATIQGAFLRKSAREPLIEVLN